MKENLNPVRMNRLDGQYSNTTLNIAKRIIYIYRIYIYD